MNNLPIIIAIAAGLSLPVSLWAIIYFGMRIIVRWYIRRHLGDMPSAEEIHQLYERNNAIIEYRDTPPLKE
jgi:hypothetical protein